MRLSEEGVLPRKERMIDPKVCHSKVFYDGEFTANRAAAIAEHRWGEEMVAYRCGTHWHITHKKKEERNKFPRIEKRDWCDACQQPIRPIRWQKHTETGSHKRKQQQLDQRNRPQ